LSWTGGGGKRNLNDKIQIGKASKKKDARTPSRRTAGKAHNRAREGGARPRSIRTRIFLRGESKSFQGWGLRMGETPAFTLKAKTGGGTNIPVRVAARGGEKRESWGRLSMEEARKSFRDLTT